MRSRRRRCGGRARSPPIRRRASTRSPPRAGSGRRSAVRGSGSMSGAARPPVLEMRGIRKTFPGVVALDAVDLTLEAGDVHMLLGENGAGKSTLMKILGGAYRKDAGEIRMNGAVVDIDSPRAARDLGIRVIYQELNLVPQLSVAENIFLGDLPSRFGGLL